MGDLWPLPVPQLKVSVTVNGRPPCQLDPLRYIHKLMGLATFHVVPGQRGKRTALKPKDSFSFRKTREKNKMPQE